MKPYVVYVQESSADWLSDTLMNRKGYGTHEIKEFAININPHSFSFFCPLRLIDYVYILAHLNNIQIIKRAMRLIWSVKYTFMNVYYL